MNKEAVISDTVHTHSHASQSSKYKRVLLSKKSDFLRYMEKNNRRTSNYWLAQDCGFNVAWEKVMDIHKFFWIQSCLKEILIFGETLTTWFHSCNAALFPSPFFPQASRNQFHSFMWVHTDTTLPTGAHPHPPSLEKNPSAPLLSSAWLSLSQQRARLGVGKCFVAQIKELK